MDKIDLSFVSCPNCKTSDLVQVGDFFKCLSADCLHNQRDFWFSSKNKIPILISDTTCDTVCNPKNIKSLVNRVKPRSIGYLIRKFTRRESQVTKSNCLRFLDLLSSSNKCPHVLIIGSGERGAGMDNLYTSKEISITGTDVYLSENVQYISDAHYLPFKESSFDGVWIQAVLEHVVDPNMVVGEIFRVLKPDGYVYSETPFMQQVHEGAFDFTRYTVLGHRYLFKNFKALDIGGNGGVGIVLEWSIKHFIWSITRSKWMARFISIPLGLIFKAVEKLADERSLYDSSSGVYFLGKKSNKTISHKDLLTLYKGFQK